jgi:F-type H+-transporting ATPase subunit epsilon
MTGLVLEIVTPDSHSRWENVDMVTLPGMEGELGIYPNHVPLMTQIIPGEVVIKKGSEEILVAIGEGFVEITAGRVAIMTDMAISANDIDEAKAEEARRKAEALLQQKLSDEEIAAANATLSKSLAQLKIKRRARKSI